MTSLKSAIETLYYIPNRESVADYIAPLATYNSEQTDRAIPISAVSDPDPGPQEVWRVTHLDYSRMSFAADDEHYYMRQWG